MPKGECFPDHGLIIWKDETIEEGVSKEKSMMDKVEKHAMLLCNYRIPTLLKQKKISIALCFMILNFGLLRNNMCIKWT